MPAGRLRERLAVLTKTRTADDRGGGVITYQTSATVAGELIPRSAAERLQASTMQAQVDYRFRVRTRTDAVLAPSARLSWTPSWGGNTQILEVRGVLPDGDGREFTLIECGRIV